MVLQKMDESFDLLSHTSHNAVVRSKYAVEVQPFGYLIEIYTYQAHCSLLDQLTILQGLYIGRYAITTIIWST